MQFGDVYGHDGQCCCSPDGRYVAHNEQSRVVVRLADTLKLHATFTAEAATLTLYWSPDSSYLLATLHRCRALQVFSLASHSFACRIEEPLGFDAAVFAPDSRHVLTTHTLSGRAALYALTTNHSYAITSLKHSSLARFSPAGGTLATVERHGHRDHLALYSLHTHQPLYHAPLPTADTARIEWAADGSRLLCIDSPVHGGACCVRAADGRVEWEWRAGEEGGAVGLGVECGAWSGCGRWLAVGRWDERVELWHVGTWTRVLQWRASEMISRGVVVYEERRSADEPQEALVGQADDEALRVEDLVGGDVHVHGRGQQRQRSNNLAASATSTRARLKSPHAAPGSRPASSSSRRPLTASNRAAAVDSVTRGLPTAAWSAAHKPHRARLTPQYAVAQLPYTLPSTEASPPMPTDTSSPTVALSPPLGVSLLSFAPDGSHLCFRLDSQPRCLYVLSVAALSLHSLLVQLQPVAQARWHGGRSARRLALCGGGLLYEWSEAGCSATELPHDEMSVQRFEVCGTEGDGALLLSDEKRYCCMYRDRAHT